MVGGWSSDESDFRAEPDDDIKDCPYCGGEVISKGCIGTVNRDGIEVEMEADWEECIDCGRLIT